MRFSRKEFRGVHCQLSGILSVIILLSSPFLSIAQEKWIVIEPPDAEFRIEFPGQPVFSSRTAPDGTTSQRYTLDVGKGDDGVQICVQWSPYKANFGYDLAKKLVVNNDDWINAIAKGLDGTVIENRQMEISGLPARTARIQGRLGGQRIMIIAGDSRSYIFMAAANAASQLDSPTVKRFFSSFSITLKPKEPFLGLPGGVPGGVPIDQLPARNRDSFIPTSEWLETHPDGNIFSIKFPKKPERSSRFKEGQGTFLKLSASDSQGGKTEDFHLEYASIEGLDPEAMRQGTVYLDNVYREMSTAMQGEVIFTKIVQVGKFPGRLVVLRLPKLQLRMKFLIVVTDSHYLNLFTLGKYGDEQFGERSDFFFSSLKLPTN